MGPVKGSLRIIILGPFDGPDEVQRPDMPQERLDEPEPFPWSQVGIGDMVDPSPALRGLAEMIMADEIDGPGDPPVLLVDQRLGDIGARQLPGQLIGFPDSRQIDFIPVGIEQRQAGVQILRTVIPDGGFFPFSGPSIPADKLDRGLFPGFKAFRRTHSPQVQYPGDHTNPFHPFQTIPFGLETAKHQGGAVPGLKSSQGEIVLVRLVDPDGLVDDRHGMPLPQQFFPGDQEAAPGPAVDFAPELKSMRDVPEE